jgi:hypothetical protein
MGAQELPIIKEMFEASVDGQPYSCNDSQSSKLTNS